MTPLILYEATTLEGGYRQEKNPPLQKTYVGILN